MSRYTKQDVETRGGFPSINVKAHPERGLQEKVMDKFKCEEREASRAIEWAWESACERFWEDMVDTLDHVYRTKVKYHQEGRSGGWLVVTSLPPLESWDAVNLSRWWRLERIIRKDITYRMSAEVMIEDIEANKWHLPGAEKYNFFDKADGTTTCIAELKAKAIDTGFGPVVRK